MTSWVFFHSLLLLVLSADASKKTKQDNGQIASHAPPTSSSLSGVASTTQASADTTLTATTPVPGWGSYQQPWGMYPQYGQVGNDTQSSCCIVQHVVCVVNKFCSSSHPTLFYECVLITICYIFFLLLHILSCSVCCSGHSRGIVTNSGVATSIQRTHHLTISSKNWIHAMLIQICVNILNILWRSEHQIVYALMLYDRCQHAAATVVLSFLK